MNNSKHKSKRFPALWFLIYRGDRRCALSKRCFWQVRLRPGQWLTMIACH